MRLAYENAYSTACLFARAPVTFIALDELRFALPVEIGSLLRLDSRVTYSPIEGASAELSSCRPRRADPIPSRPCRRAQELPRLGAGRHD